MANPQMVIFPHQLEHRDSTAIHGRCSMRDRTFGSTRGETTKDENRSKALKAGKLDRPDGWIFLRTVFWLANLTLPEINSSPLKIGRNAPKGKDHLPTIRFSGVMLVSGRVRVMVSSMFSHFVAGGNAFL